MIITSLCYIEKNGSYLMLHRNKKKNDINHDKWLGIGGKFEVGETPEECAKREIYEETGLIADKLYYRGVVNFVSDVYEEEIMHLFTCDSFLGTLKERCDEGELVWVKKNEVTSLPIWEGDKIFFKLLDNEERFFNLKLIYSGDTLISHEIEMNK
jgi:8-oxo-dGTP diphosphatase